MTRAEAYWILEEIRRECVSVDHVKALGIAQETIEFVDLMPDDVVRVVRCKDCKHWGGVVFGNVCRRWSAPLTGMRNDTKPDDFCSYGERKDGDGNG